MPEWWWCGIIVSVITLGFSLWYTRSVRNPEDWTAFHALMMLLGTCGAAGVILLGAVGIITLFFS